MLLLSDFPLKFCKLAQCNCYIRLTNLNYCSLQSDPSPQIELGQLNAAAANLGPAIDRFLPVADKTIVVVERAAVLIQSANQAATTANQMMQDVRPRIAEISGETVAIVRSGREQVERMGGLVHDAG